MDLYNQYEFNRWLDNIDILEYTIVGFPMISLFASIQIEIEVDNDCEENTETSRIK